MMQLIRTALAISLLLMVAAFSAQDAKKKYHILYSGQGEGAYGPCG